ncbi:hypothetical protein CW710_00995 [Candidatus Bathyarchaeota archaeon]|nr:hypothetical protein [Candidatus Bathyarchaeota archaeon]RJS74734.1 MAG: hypothetical protein CW710_00995 [Candidatus Bathyarchaeota archaeon]
MPKSKLRFEAEDESGVKLTITLEGNLSRDKVLQVLDLVELMGGLSKNAKPTRSLEGSTKLEKIKKLIVERLPMEWFSSRDVQAEYEELYGEPIRLSTVSTYLQRLHSSGFLLRSGSRAMRTYKLNSMSVSDISGSSRSR